MAPDFLHNKSHSSTIKTIRLPGLAQALLALINKIYYLSKIKSRMLTKVSFLAGNLKTLFDYFETFKVL